MQLFHSGHTDSRYGVYRKLNNDDDDDDDDDDDNNNNNLIIIIIMIIVLKGENRDFYHFLTAPRTVFNTYAQAARCNRVQITCNTSSAHHVQSAVCYLVRRDSSAIKFDRVELAFIYSFV